MDEKSLGDLLSAYMKQNEKIFVAKKFFDAWPVISGPRLSSCSVLDKVNVKEGKIVVHATSLSSRSLLVMEKKRIIKDWNSFFPEEQIKEIVVAKRT